MLEKKWKSLKNGSDIRGIAIKDDKEVNLTDDVICAITKAFALWLSKKCKKTELLISVGHDSRLSADRIKDDVLKSLVESGVSCFNCELMSTPAMFMTCISPDTNCDGAIQITASHLPFDRNGLKFFTKEGGLDGSDIDEILILAQNGDALTGSGKIVEFDFLSLYCDMLVNKVRNAVNAEDFEHPLKGFKIIVDAGNGAGGFYATKVLLPLGADITGSQFLEPDGHFSNHIPNPENEEAMASISHAVLNFRADMGLIFDTDVDRAGAVDSCGNEINRNRLIALISAILLEERRPAVIVTDSITSKGLRKFIENHGGMHHRFKRGYKNVINEAVRLNREGQFSPLAIETSGHAALKENYFLDDGAYLVTKLLIKAAQMKKEGKKLEDLLIGLDEPKEGKEFRFNIALDDFAPYGNEVIKALTENVKNLDGASLETENYEGVRINFDESNGNGWLLLRLSLHEPLMVMNIESDTDGGVKQIAQKLADFFASCDKLDVSPLTEYLK